MKRLALIVALSCLAPGCRKKPEPVSFAGAHALVPGGSEDDAATAQRGLSLLQSDTLITHGGESKGFADKRHAVFVALAHQEVGARLAFLPEPGKPKLPGGQLANDLPVKFQDTVVDTTEHATVVKSGTELMGVSNTSKTIFAKDSAGTVHAWSETCTERTGSGDCAPLLDAFALEDESSYAPISQ